MSGQVKQSSQEKNEEKKLLMEESLKQHEEFLVIGLTGRLGSGCSEAAGILGSSFEQIALPHIKPGANGLMDDKERDFRILYDYASHHWLKFDVIRVRTIITLFLLGQFQDFLKDLVKCHLFSCAEDFASKAWEKVTTLLEKRSPQSFDDLSVTLQQRAGQQYKALVAAFNNPGNFDEKILENTFEDCQSAFEAAYRDAEHVNNYPNRTNDLCRIDDILNIFSAYAAKIWWKKNTLQPENLKTALDVIVELFHAKPEELNFQKYFFVHDLLPAVSDSLHELITEKSQSVFTELFQKYGNSIRKYGKVFPKNKKENAVGVNDVYSIPRRINHFIKSLRHPFSRSFAKPTRIVIDSIKSAHESTYLRERYSAFYLIAISCNESIRKERLSNEKNLTLADIRCIDWNEYSDIGADKYKKITEITGNNDDYYDKIKTELGQYEAEFYRKVIKPENGIPRDEVRIKAYENGLYPFVLQNVGASIQDADIFISNNHIGSVTNMDLRWELVRNISLISHPGLLLPTPVERCMQVAFTAKANSGCLSRQVGAVVTDADFNILSIGWNDVPCGDITCTRKNLIDLYHQHDIGSYSDYELQNAEFRDRINNLVAQVSLSSDELDRKLNGLPWRYCFKDIHADNKQSMRSRAMHAEEKAMSNVASNAEGGCLFTTSSPCEMCSKNAKNHKIKRIYYIEPYPGISEEQYTNSGNRDNRAEHILFCGAIGRAYTQMYTPIMPHKDVLAFLGLPSKFCKASCSK